MCQLTTDTKRPKSLFLLERNDRKLRKTVLTNVLQTVLFVYKH